MHRWLRTKVCLDAVRARYLFGTTLDEIIARYRPNEGTAWYLTDHLGSVRDIVDGAGQRIDHIDYDSFGVILAETNPAAGDRFKFTGREWNAELGLYYYRARMYTPATGRFMIEDRLGLVAQDTNLYRYVFNRPTTLTDPHGMSSTTGGAVIWGRLKPHVIAGAVSGGIAGFICGFVGGWYSVQDNHLPPAIRESRMYGAAGALMGAALGPISATFLAPIFITAGVALTAAELQQKAKAQTLIFKREILCIILPALVSGIAPKITSRIPKLIPQRFRPRFRIPGLKLARPGGVLRGRNPRGHRRQNGRRTRGSDRADRGSGRG